MGRVPDVTAGLPLAAPTPSARYAVDNALTKSHELVRSLQRDVFFAAMPREVAQDAQTFDRIMRLGSS